MFSDIVRVCQIQHECSMVYTPQGFLFEFILLSRLLIAEMCMPDQLDILQFLKMLIFWNFLYIFVLTFIYFVLKIYCLSVSLLQS